MQPAPSSPSLETPPSAAGMSLCGRLFNIFVTPGDVFEELKAGRSCVGNWLAPALLWAMVGVVSTVVIFSQEAVVFQLRQQQEQALEKKLAKAPPEVREQAIAQVQRFTSPAVLTAFGSVFAVGLPFFWLFGVALAVWLIGRFILKGNLEYLPAVEVSGLSGMIWVLGSILGTLLVLITGNLQTNLGPMLLLREYNPANLSHQFLGSLNVITFWYLAVLALGLARLTAVSWLKAGLWLFIPYAVLKSGWIVVTWLLQRQV